MYEYDRRHLTHYPCSRSLKLKRKVATTANSLMEREKKKHKPTIPWVERLEELTAFRARFGHCNVPKEWPVGSSYRKFVT